MRSIVNLRRASARSALLALTALAGLVLAAAPVRAAAVPAPSADPFYAAPAGFAAMPNGTVLRERQITPTLLSVPLPAVTAWQLLYRSTDSSGAATADVTTVLVPSSRWTGGGARPIVSYQTAEDSVGSQCAPSYVIRAGVPGATSNAAGEVPLIESMLTRGWAVVTPDYEGPDSQFLAAGQEGHAVLDGIRAARAFAADGLGPSDPVALWGYSGGSFASAWAAQLQPSYAPELPLAGMAVGGTIADAGAAIDAVDGSYGAGLVFGVMIGLQRAYPSAFSGLYTPAGAAKLLRAGGDCTDQLLTTFAFQPFRSVTVSSRPLQLPALQALFARDSPLGHGAPHTPVYDYHTIHDEFVPVATDDALVRQYCAAGTPVETVRYAYGEHNSTLATGAPGAQAFLAARFAGAAPLNDCPAGSGTPARATTPQSKPKRHRHRPRRHHRRRGRHA